jgi:hypothetical protein
MVAGAVISNAERSLFFTAPHEISPSGRNDGKRAWWRVLSSRTQREISSSPHLTRFLPLVEMKQTRSHLFCKKFIHLRISAYLRHSVALVSGRPDLHLFLQIRLNLADRHLPAVKDARCQGCFRVGPGEHLKEMFGAAGAAGGDHRDGDR